MARPMTRFLSAILLLASVACGPPVAAGFDKYGYHNDANPYRVVTVKGQIIGDDWLIDNYFTRGGKLEPKNASEYLITYEVDIDDDGRIDFKYEAFLYDLRYSHKSHGAHIWLRTFPIPPKLREMQLRVLAQRYVDAVAGSGFEAVRVDNTTVVGQTRRFAPKVLERGPARVAGADAYLVNFDVVNVDQATVSAGSHTDRVSVVLIRPPFNYRIAKTGFPPSEYPALMLAGYANLPEDFDKDLTAFHDLLGRIQLGQCLGYKQLSVEKIDAAISAPPPPPAAAEAPVSSN